MKKKDDYRKPYEGMTEEERIKTHIREMKRLVATLDSDLIYATSKEKEQLYKTLIQIDDQTILINDWLGNEDDPDKERQWFLIDVLLGWWRPKGWD